MHAKPHPAPELTSLTPCKPSNSIKGLLTTVSLQQQRLPYKEVAHERADSLLDQAFGELLGDILTALTGHSSWDCRCGLLPTTHAITLRYRPRSQSPPMLISWNSPHCNRCSASHSLCTRPLPVKQDVAISCLVLAYLKVGANAYKRG